jgi:hypothetical protein
MYKLNEQEVEKRTHSNKMTALVIVSLVALCCVWTCVGWIYDMVVL